MSNISKLTTGAALALALTGSVALAAGAGTAKPVVTKPVTAASPTATSNTRPGTSTVNPNTIMRDPAPGQGGAKPAKASPPHIIQRGGTPIKPGTSTNPG